MKLKHQRQKMKKQKRNAKPAAAVKSNPYLEAKNLEKAEHEAARFPTVNELTQIAAILSRNEDWHEGRPRKSVGEAAYNLWESCGHLLKKKIEEAIIWEEIYSDQEYVQQHDMPDWVDKLPNDNSPIPFENALRLIVGKKIRKPDRYKAYRDFLRHALQKWAKDETDLELRVENKFAERKSNGFRSADVISVEASFGRWKKTQNTEKARRAAVARWKKNVKNS